MPKQTPPPPLLTYISKKVSDGRTKWYLNHKRPIMDKIVHKYNRGHTEREYFYYSDPRVISELFGHVLENKNYTGLRIHLGSCRDLIPAGCDTGDKGKLVLIYVPTTKEKDENVNTEYEKPYKDSGEYFKLRPRGCSRVTLDKSVFDHLVDNNREKSAALRISLSTVDLNDHEASEETKSLFIDRERIKEIKDEIEYQLDMSAQYGVAGIKVYINSYTDKPVQSGRYLLRQRLTVQFVFTDDAGQDLDLIDIDPRYKELKKGWKKDPKKFLIGYNTMNPTPPYP